MNDHTIHLQATLMRLQRRLSLVFGQDVRIMLFGSQVRGDATVESDVDVLALLPDLSPASISVALDTAWVIGFEAGLVISLIPATESEFQSMGASQFFQNVRQEGISV